MTSAPTRLTHKSFVDDVASFEFTIDSDYRGEGYAAGKGTLILARAFTALGDEAVTEIGDCRVVVYIDLHRLWGTHLRAQYIMGKWVLTNRKLIERCAIFGARPWERRLAQAVIRIARLRSVRLFAEASDALDFLGWRALRYAPDTSADGTH